MATTSPLTPPPDTQDHRALLEHLIATSPMVMFRRQPNDQTLTYVSPNMESVLGYSPEEVLGVPSFWIEHLHPDDREHFMAESTREPDDDTFQLERDYRFRNKSGEYRWLHTVVRWERDGSGAPTSIIGYAQDVTDRKRLREERDRFFALSRDLLAIIGFDGYLKRLNPVWEQVLGSSREALTAGPFLDLVHPDDRERTRAELDRLAGGDDARSFENRMSGGRRRYRWLLWNATAFPEQGLIYATARDITERKRMELELARRAEELASSNAELEQFASIASHDLQEPLRIITGYVQLLERRHGPELDDEAKEFIGYAVDGAARMQTLINDLLSYSRVGARPKPQEPTELGLSLDVALANLKAAIDDSGAIVTRDDLPVIVADSSQLTQVFQNLISNAIKFRGDELPRIHVGVEQRAREVEITVRDNGIGIDEEYAERIFGMFQRLHGRSEYPGTGIGLAICRKIVERHGGRIWVESEPGAGSTFRMVIPEKGGRS